MSELLGLILLVSFIAGFLIIAAEDFIWDCLVKQFLVMICKVMTDKCIDGNDKIMMKMSFQHLNVADFIISDDQDPDVLRWRVWSQCRISVP